jgi:hypothetical protein
MENKIAGRNSWKNLPLPEEREELNVEAYFSDEEFRLIFHGLIPVVMEDKWFIFLADNNLYIHRSWTGYCIYQVRFTKKGNGFCIEEAWVNRNRDQYKENDLNYDRELLIFLIDRFLLNRRTRIPERKSNPRNDGE